MTKSLQESDQQEIIAVTDREVAAVRDEDHAAYLCILADDAVFLPPSLLPKGGEELRRWLDEFLRGFAVEWLDFVHEEVSVEGDLAYHVYLYRWRVTPRSGGEGIISQGKGMHILRRQPDGSWKIAREIWNDNLQIEGE